MRPGLAQSCLRRSCAARAGPSPCDSVRGRRWLLASGARHMPGSPPIPSPRPARWRGRCPRGSGVGPSAAPSLAEGSWKARVRGGSWAGHVRGRGTRWLRSAGSSFPVLPLRGSWRVCPGSHPGLRGPPRRGAGRGLCQTARGRGDVTPSQPGRLRGKHAVGGKRGCGLTRPGSPGAGRSVRWRPPSPSQGDRTAS